jgi:hypothetical protein
MQRTALQGSPARLSMLTGSWIKGAPASVTAIHPFKRHFDTLAVGDTVETGAREITLDDIEHFAHFTGDTFYAHMDEEAAKANPSFQAASPTVILSLPSPRVFSSIRRQGRFWPTMASTTCVS